MTKPDGRSDSGTGGDVHHQRNEPSDIALSHRPDIPLESSSEHPVAVVVDGNGTQRRPLIRS